MEMSIFRSVSIGRSVVNKERSSRRIEVLPVEVATATDGVQEFSPNEEVLTGEDKDGNIYNLKVITTRTWDCEWLPNEDNRATAPDVRVGELVEVFRLGDTDQYFWRSMALRNNLRTLESAVFTFNASPNPSGGGIDFNTCYFMQFSAHDKHITIGTSKANGEAFKYTFQINTGDSAVYLLDDTGNLIELDSKDRRIQLKNADGSFVKVERNTIDLNASEYIKMTCGGTTFELKPDAINSNTTNTTLVSKSKHLTKAPHIVEETDKWDII